MKIFAYFLVQIWGGVDRALRSGFGDRPREARSKNFFQKNISFSEKFSKQHKGDPYVFYKFFGKISKKT